MKTSKLFTLLLAIVWSIQMFGQTQSTLFFDGTDDFVDCGTNPELNITGNITIELWIYLNSSLTIYERIVEKDWATSYWLGGKYGLNGLAFGMDPNGSTANLLETGSNVLSQNVWTHIAGTWDGATLRIYVNGEEVASKPWVNNAVDGSSNSTKLGKYYGPDNYFFRGYMDEVRIWNVARTQQELRDNMYRELENPGAEANLVAYYGFNEGSGQTTSDLSTNSNTGILGGTTAVESSDPAWITSTAPIPYYSVNNGFWGASSTWASGQQAPTKAWTRAEINHLVEINADAIAKDITINTSGSMTVNNSYDLTVTGDFLIKSDATGTGSYINNGSNTFGNSIFERYYAGGEWHLISSPVVSATSGMFTGLYLQHHTESTNGYTDITATTSPLNPMQGYALFNNNSAVAAFNGMFNDGPVGAGNNLTRSGSGYNDFGWNLIGNPYPSTIDWDAVSGWTKTNVDNATYIHVNASTWATYIAGVGTNGGSQFIAPGQGFFVSVTDNAGTYPEYGSLQMNDDVRAHHNTPFYKNEISNLVKLKISGNGYSDETVIRFVENASASFDGNWDAHKLFGIQNDAPQIYSHLDLNYAINALAEKQPVVIGVRSIENGIFTIEATDILDIETLYLKDHQTGIVTDLLNDTYTFNYEPGVMDNRFTLYFKSTLDITPNVLNNAMVIGLNKAIMVNVPGNISGSMMVYNITGQLVQSIDIHQGKNHLNAIKAGTYIVKIVTNDQVITRKVMVN
jgi:hypothetical protein